MKHLNMERRITIHSNGLNNASVRHTKKITDILNRLDGTTADLFLFFFIVFFFIFFGGRGVQQQ